MNKHELESRLAELADGGVIVEIGVGGGNGVRALYDGTRLGRRLRIYAVDPYLPHTDLNDAQYGPETKQKFLASLQADPNLAKDVVLVEKDGTSAGREWSNLPVALVWIDMTDPVSTLRPLVDAWLPHVVPGGYLVVNNLEYVYRGCGAAQVAAYVESLPGWRRLDIDGQQVAAVLRRDPPSRAVFYIAHGNQYVEEAETSARSVRRFMPSADTAIICAPGVKTGADWTRTFPILERQHKTWYCDNVAYIRRAMDLLGDYDELLYLDSDTIIARSADELWLALQEADLAFGHGAERDNNQSIYGAPAAFATPMIGVNLFRNTPLMREFVDRWLALYEAHEDFYGENDQYPLRDLLWRNELMVRYVVLPPEFACRHNFGCWVKGMVRMLHGRLPNMSKTLEQAAVEINQDHTMRIYHPRFGFLWSADLEKQGKVR